MEAFVARLLEVIYVVGQVMIQVDDLKKQLRRAEWRLEGSVFGLLIHWLKSKVWLSNHQHRYRRPVTYRRARKQPTSKRIIPFAGGLFSC